ncbi:MAG: hypothetical protein ACI959_002067 [Limisphaerales bacterium]|jgi:hypothetical protein
MQNSLTYRARKRNLELSLWVGNKGLFNSTLAVLLSLTFLATPVFAIIGMRLEWITFGQAMIGILLAGTFLGFLGQHLLWRSFGREVIELGAGMCRIYSDYRLFRKLHVEVPFEACDITYWTSVKNQTRAGNLILTFDNQTLRSKVGLPRPELERAVLLVKRYIQSTHIRTEHMYVLHNN